MGPGPQVASQPELQLSSWRMGHGRYRKSETWLPCGSCFVEKLLLGGIGENSITNPVAPSPVNCTRKRVADGA